MVDAADAGDVIHASIVRGTKSIANFKDVSLGPFLVFEDHALGESDLKVNRRSVVHESIILQPQDL